MSQDNGATGNGLTVSTLLTIATIIVTMAVTWGMMSAESKSQAATMGKIEAAIEIMNRRIDSLQDQSVRNSTWIDDHKSCCSITRADR